jgi:serine phosphatase RsbU (regulator of sigma subunit)
VGGDFFDTIPAANGAIVIVIADVMGKGVPAAMFASLLRASIRARVDVTTDPGELLTQVNRLLTDDLALSNMFITAAIATLTADGNGFAWANAGHPQAKIFRPGEKVALRIEDAANVPLGILADANYETTHVDLATDAVATIFTDGLYEIDRGAGELFGLPRLAEHLPIWWQGDLQAYADDTLRHLHELEPDAPSDDRTIVAFRRRVTPASSSAL